MSRPIACLLLVIAAYLTGCTTYAAPEIRVLRALPADRTAEAMTIDFDLAMVNPNDEPLDIRWVEYTFGVGGDTIYTGRHAIQSTLPARDVAAARIPAVLRFDQVNGAMHSATSMPGDWWLDGSLIYIPPDEITQVLTDGRIFFPRAGFSADRDNLYPQGAEQN